MNKGLAAFLMAFFLTGSIFLMRPMPKAALPTYEKPVKFYANRQLATLYPTLITSANSSLHVFIYTLKERLLIDQLRKRSGEVAVHVLYDAEQGKGLRGSLGPKVFGTAKKVRSGIMHSKVLSVDKKVSVIGTANLTNESLRIHRNLAAGFYSPQLAEMIEEKGRGYKTLAHRVFPIGPQSVEMWFIPDDPGGIERVRQVIRTAKKTVQIAMFAWSNQDLADEVIEAKERGVNVAVLLERQTAAGYGNRVFRRLKNAGISIKLSEPGQVLHHKMLLADETLVLGSPNWTKKAFSQNHESFFILSPLTEEQQGQLQLHWKELEQECKVRDI